MDDDWGGTPISGKLHMEYSQLPVQWHFVNAQKAKFGQVSLLTNSFFSFSFSKPKHAQPPKQHHLVIKHMKNGDIWVIYPPTNDDFPQL